MKSTFCAPATPAAVLVKGFYCVRAFGSSVVAVQQSVALVGVDVPHASFPDPRFP